MSSKNLSLKSELLNLRKTKDMKTKFTLLLLSFIVSVGLIAQTNVNLIVNHKLGTADFTMASPGTNNLGVNFNLDRIQYYVSQFIIVHDGGLETAIVDLYALIDGSGSSQVTLGDLSFTTIEGIKFSVGVDQARNHLDPASYSSFHPLAPKNPSMHWGWTSGYRFVAMEGNAGSNLSTLFEIHALGDANYFEVSIPLSALSAENGVLNINIDADYAEGIKDIDVSTGVFSHGDINESITLLQNFQTNVFKQTEADTAVISGIISLNNINQIYVYPNPTSGILNFSSSEIIKVEVYSLIGKLVTSRDINSASSQLTIQEKGLYILKVYGTNQKISSIKVLVK